MGELEEPAWDWYTSRFPSRHPGEEPAPANSPSDAAPEPAKSFRVRARKPLTPATVLEEAGGYRSPVAGAVLDVHYLMRERSRLYGIHLRMLAELYENDSENGGVLEDADMTGMKIAAGLRCSTAEATDQIHDALRAVHRLPTMFAHLERGDLPEPFFRYLLRQVQSLDDDQVEMVDLRLHDVDVANVSQGTFEKQVRYAVAEARKGTLPTLPSPTRKVELGTVDPVHGTASITITGPILEIRALAHRLDSAARTVQDAQRHALAEGEEGPMPFDLDDVVRSQGRPLSLRRLQYAILTHSVLDIDPVEETRSVYKMLLTVPVTTMLGVNNHPAMLEGMTPIPAEQARELAAEEATWTRILTDPITGAYLPVSATTYRPTAQMRLLLRLRHPICAAPGCTRPTAYAAEDDHIEEYDHEEPDLGGRTSLFNLHRLCWLHHAWKTKDLIDVWRWPIDDPSEGDGTTTPDPLRSVWDLGDGLRTPTLEDTDLVSPTVASELEEAWRVHEAERANIRAYHAAVRRDLERHSTAREGRRIIPPGAGNDTDTDVDTDEEDLPF